MRLALLQAHKMLGNTQTNPSVGCVIVKNNCLISASSTSFGGRPHAEFNAINQLKYNVKDLKLYSTLEPCSHYGKTQPCVNHIIRKKIKKVYFSIKDPDLRSYDKSANYFKKNKINFKKGIYSNEINSFYQSYIKYKKKGLPFVTAKIALSKDYYAKAKKNKFITNEFSRGRVHLLRSKHDCIITSFKTVKDDNPQLNCRIFGLEKHSPSRVILDTKLKISANCNLLKTANIYKTIIFYNYGNKKKLNKLKRLNVKLYRTSLNEAENLDLEEILNRLKTIGFSRIFLEAGIGLTASFLANNLIDDFHIFISNRKLKNNGDKNFKKIANLFLKDKKYKYQKVNLLGDKLITYKMK